MYIDQEERNNQNSENEQNLNLSSHLDSSNHSESSSDQNNEEAKAIPENRVNREDSFHLHIHNSITDVLNDEHAGLN